MVIRKRQVCCRYIVGPGIPESNSRHSREYTERFLFGVPIARARSYYHSTEQGCAAERAVAVDTDNGHLRKNRSCRTFLRQRRPESGCPEFNSRVIFPRTAIHDQAKGRSEICTVGLKEFQSHELASICTKKISVNSC